MTKKQYFKPLVCLLAFVGAFAHVVRADEVPSDMAVAVAKVWLAQNKSPLGEALRGEPSLVESHTNSAGKVVFHVIQFSEGGYIWLAADMAAGPVLAIAPGKAGSLGSKAYSAGINLAESDLAKGQELEIAAANTSSKVRTIAASATLPSKERWAKLLNGLYGIMTLSAAPVDSVGDVRVSPLVRTKWGQSTVGGRNFFNAYTPRNYVCGCVATAGAQVMKYFEHPASTPSFKKTCYINSSYYTTNITIAAHTYNWDQMPCTPTGYFHEGQVSESGFLTAAISASCQATYGYSATSASLNNLTERLKDTWGYASAKYKHSSSGFTTTDVASYVLPSLNSKKPVILGIRTADNSGHAVVADGYGYQDGVLFLHLNMGWDGYSDMWYNMPNVPTDDYTFSTLNEILYNIYPGNTAVTGISGRFLAKDGTPLANAIMKGVLNGVTYTATTDENGLYSFTVPTGTSGTMTVTPTYDSGEGNSFTISYGGSSAVQSADTSLSFDDRADELKMNAIDPADAKIKLGFTAVKGRTYRVESTTDLSGSWSTKKEQKATATGVQTVEFARDTTKKAQFFRVARDTAFPEEETVNDPVESDYTWTKTCNGDTTWQTVTDNSYDEGSAEKIILDYYKTATYEATLNGPLLMSFKFRYCLATDSYVSLLVDGNEVYKYGGKSTDTGWVSAMAEIPEGVHTVTIKCYRSGYYFTSGTHEYYCMIDDIDFASKYTSAPTIAPASTTAEATAVKFTGSKQITITGPDGAKIYYTYDSSMPTPETGILYTGPFTIKESSLAQAIAVKDGCAQSGVVKALYRKSASGPGEWTSDSTAAFASAKTNGKMSVIVIENISGCGYCRALEPITHSSEFLAWAKNNKVYLIMADTSRYPDAETAYNDFWTKYNALGLSGSVSYTTMIFCKPDGTASSYFIGQSGQTYGSITYDGTVSSLISVFNAALSSVSK